MQGRRDHEAYTGDRTKEALVRFADSLVPSAGMPHVLHGDLKSAPKTSGCTVAGAAQIASSPAAQLLPHVLSCCLAHC